MNKLDAMEEAIMQKIHYWYDSQETDTPQEMGALRAGIGQIIAQEEAQPKSFAQLYADNTDGIAVERLAMTKEAQTVEPITANDFMERRCRELKAMDRGDKAAKQPLPAEREVLLAELRKNHKNFAGYWGTLSGKAADMLAADAKDAFAAGMACRPASAQQVAVPQWNKPIGEVFAHQPMGCFLVRPIGDAAPTLSLGDKLYLAAAPQPPQAERVPMPMTDEEARAMGQEWYINDESTMVLIRRAEAHHGIGEKP